MATESGSEEVLFKVVVDGTERGIKSLADVTAASRALREERAKLDLTTATGKERLSQINDALDKNNAKMKESSSALEKQRLNVGNYTGALDKLVPGLGATISGFQGMTKAALAFIATPIGLVIGALALAVATLAQYFTRTEEGGDKLAKVMAQLGAMLNIVLDRVGQLGGALVKLWNGDVLGAFDQAKTAVSGVADEMEREWELAGQLADILDELEDRELSYSVAVSESANQVKQLIIASKNRLITEEQKIKLLEQANDIEVRSNEVAKKNQMDRIDAATKQIEMDFNQLGITQQLGESEIEYAKRIVDNSQITVAARKPVADALIKYNEIQGTSLNLQEKIGNLIDQRGQKAEIERASVEAITEAKRHLVEVNNVLATAGIQQIDITQKGLDISNLEDNIAKRYIATTKQKAEVTRILTDRQKDQALALQALSQSLNQAASLFEKNSIAYRIIMSGQATIDAWRSFNLALATFPPPFGEISGGFSLAAGLAAVAKINEVSFAAGGGSFMTRGPQMLIVGDNPGGVERVDVTPVSGTGKTKVAGNMIAMAGGGSLIAQGFGAREAAMASEAQMRNSDLYRSITQIKTYIAVEDYRIGDKRYAEVVDNATK